MPAVRPTYEQRQVRFITQNKHEVIDKSLYILYPKIQNGYYTKAQIEQEINKFRRRYCNRSDKYKIKFNLYTSTVGCIPSNTLPLTDRHLYVRDTTMEYKDLFDFTDLEIEYFDILMFKEKPRHGGADKHNDCLYYTLKDCGINKWMTPSLFKRFLGLKRDDMVDVKDLNKIEHATNIGIELVGDEARYPVGNFKRIVTIRITMGHFSPFIRKTKGMVFKLKKDKQFRLYQNKDCKIIYYDGENMTETMTREINKKYFDVNLDEVRKPFIKNYPETEPSFENLYKYMRKCIDDVKTDTGFIDMYKTGWINRTFAYLMFPRIQALGYDFEDIEQYEYEYLEAATSGAYCWYKPNEYEKLYEYDYSGYYPSLLMNKYFTVPFKAGKVEKLTTEQISKWKTFQSGLYFCEVEYKEECKYKFRYNGKNCYTQYDLNNAKKLGLNITMNEEREHNFLHYRREDCFPIHQIFDKYYTEMDKFKQEHPENFIYKSLMSTNWGYLCSYLKHYIKFNEKGNGETDVENYTIKKYDKNTFEIINNLSPYRYAYARFKPFILSKGRDIIFNEVLNKYENDCVRVQTDGFLMKKYIPEFDNIKKIGNIVLQGMMENVNLISTRTIKKTDLKK